MAAADLNPWPSAIRLSTCFGRTISRPENSFRPGWGSKLTEVTADANAERPPIAAAKNRVRFKWPPGSEIKFSRTQSARSQYGGGPYTMQVGCGKTRNLTEVRAPTDPP